MEKVKKCLNYSGRYQSLIDDGNCAQQCISHPATQKEHENKMAFITVLYVTLIDYDVLLSLAIVNEHYNSTVLKSVFYFHSKRFAVH